MIKSSFLAVLFDILSKIVFDWIFKDPRKTYSKPRSTYPQVFYKIGPLKLVFDQNNTKTTGKVFLKESWDLVILKIVY